MNGMNGMVRGTWKTRALLETVRGHGMVHFDAGSGGHPHRSGSDTRVKNKTSNRFVASESSRNPP
jgi:hypothetical protein